MVSQDVFDRVVKSLRSLERRHGVRVLYACESGSRAWGFASSDSDYDVRFLYVHSRDWYLAVEEGRDVIEEPMAGDLDVCGWDLRKALRLLRKSNPALMEWLSSPVVYAGEQVFHDELRELAAACFSPLQCFRHYQSMAQGHARKYLAQDQVRLKKYLYTLRPLLACRWIERGLGQPAMQLDQLIAAVLPEPEVRAALGELVSAKREGEELESGPRVEVLSGFVETELLRLSGVTFADAPPPAADSLDRFFLRQLA